MHEGGVHSAGWCSFSRVVLIQQGGVRSRCSSSRRSGVQDSLLHHAGIRVHVGKTKVWNKSGVRPEICDVLERIARDNDQQRPSRRVPVCLDQQGVEGPPRIPAIS